MVGDGDMREVVDGSGDTYLLSMCMTRMEEVEGEEEMVQLCGEYWFLVPPVSAVLDKTRPDHQVLLLVDKEQYDTQNEVVVYIPTSHVLLHEADMLSVQLLHDSNATVHADHDHGGDECWHDKPTARIIHTQNITFNKYPGQNIRVRLTHFLPSGKYQLAMVPYKKDVEGRLRVKNLIYYLISVVQLYISISCLANGQTLLFSTS